MAKYIQIAGRSCAARACSRVLNCLVIPPKLNTMPILVWDDEAAGTWQEIRDIRFNEQPIVARSPILILNAIQDYGIGTTSVPSPVLLKKLIEELSRCNSLSEVELKSCRARFIQDVPSSVKNKAISLWHDLRNDCSLLLDSWELLIEDPDDSFAFTCVDEKDAFVELNNRSDTVVSNMQSLLYLFQSWFPRRELEPIHDIVLSVFRFREGETGILTLFLKNYAPRHPKDAEIGARARYRSLVEALTLPEAVELARKLRKALSRLEVAVNECFRGKILS